MSATTFKAQGVSLAKKGDVLTNPDLWEQNAHLSNRLFEVARELDALKHEVAEAEEGKIELIRMVFAMADQRELAALVATARQDVIDDLKRELAQMTAYRNHYKAQAEEWRRKCEVLRAS
ncbi:hypothetical protein ACFVKC_02060 [Streptomyces noursei]|uniref:hypothetical protein n=1 Tax=Streptomyces noursei TaxID=1971 RepID=UPI003630AE71